MKVGQHRQDTALLESNRSGLCRHGGRRLRLRRCYWRRRSRPGHCEAPASWPNAENSGGAGAEPLLRGKMLWVGAAGNEVTLRDMKKNRSAAGFLKLTS